MTRPFTKPDWPAPPGVFALSTLRWGGASQPPYDSFNLGAHVGDATNLVAQNRSSLAEVLPAGSQIQWLQQVHGKDVVEALGAGFEASADACFSRRQGVACAVLTADCLPVLLCSERSDVVAAAHGGWRGLCNGVLEAVVSRLQTDPGQIMAWLGPAIGPRAFEVGPEVREQFLAGAGPQRADLSACFTPSAGREGHFFADLYALARQRLAALGVRRVYGGGECTYSDSRQYFSYRRDGQTGRMATLILLKDETNTHLK